MLEGECAIHTLLALPRAALILSGFCVGPCVCCATLTCCVGVDPRALHALHVHARMGLVPVTEIRTWSPRHKPERGAEWRRPVLPFLAAARSLLVRSPRAPRLNSRDIAQCLGWTPYLLGRVHVVWLSALPRAWPWSVRPIPEPPLGCLVSRILASRAGLSALTIQARPCAPHTFPGPVVSPRRRQWHPARRAGGGQRGARG